MPHKAVITRRGTRGLEAFDLESADALATGLTVEQRLPHGALVSGDEQELAALEKRGYRVKLLPDTNLLHVGAYRINIRRKPPKVPAELDLPKRLARTWPHHLVQLAAPPEVEWIAEIEALGVEVVEPVSMYGLFVVAPPAQMTAVAELSYVTWTGPFLPAYRVGPGVKRLKGLVQYLSIAVYPPSTAAAVRAVLEKVNASIVRETTSPTPYGKEYHVFKASLDARHIPALASLPTVRWVEHEALLEPLGERETQIVAEQLDGGAPPNTAPVPGYQAWLAAAGVSGQSVTIAVADTGIDANANNNVTAHADLQGRQVAFVDYTNSAVTTDTNGHGTNVAGIALGNAASGQTEAVAPANFLWGQGMAPQSQYVTQNFLLANPQPATATLIQDAANNGAGVMNNSWGVDNSGGSGYVARSRTIDLAVRDPDSGTAELDYVVIVCAAGNEGGNVSTISNPHESKNDIVAGNSLTSRPGTLFPADDIRGISGTSSRGPAVDGRIMPTVVAPGTNVSAALSRTSTLASIPGTGTPDPNNPGQTINRYVFMTGTSQAAPHVSGACALLIDWWRQRTGGRNPSPALLKALLVNGAEDLVGGQNWRCLNRTTADKATWSSQGNNIFRRTMTFTPAAVVEGNVVLTPVASLANLTAQGQWFFDAGVNRLFVRMNGNANPGAFGVAFLHGRDATPVANVPNGHQGWGRISMENMLFQTPQSDRGPKIFSDQRHAFTASGQEFLIRVAAADPARPVRMTLVWTDAAGAAGANPALVNDLDLEVTETASNTVFKGNVFTNGFSVTGGNFDALNNVECVYLQNPNGAYEVRVVASNIAASARPDIQTPWQDFALVLDNVVVPGAAPVSVVPVIDRSGSMIAYGYEAITRISSKQFVDLMSVDDELGVVSFGSTGTVEFPAGANPLMQTITGPATQASANTEIDGIAFGGCTYMGDGVVKARDLLAGAVHPGAMVLLSDGYDNKGCQPNNASRPSALNAAATLPPALPVYTCAMGPASDQALLEQMASATGGRYYYMPTIDDLFEIYNYIRGQVSGDSIVANESAEASSSRVAAFVDAGATRATFSVAWADLRLFYSPDPRKLNEIGIRLRDPHGRLVPANDSYVQRTIGNGYVIFTVHDPMPGQWHVEVTTLRETHVRYTVGGFVRSPIRLTLRVKPTVPSAGFPLTLTAGVMDGKTDAPGFRIAGFVTAPSASLEMLAEKHKAQLRNVRPIKVPGGDALPPHIGRLVALRGRLLADRGTDIFAPTRMRVAFGPATPDATGQLAVTAAPGSYNIAVAASGHAPLTGGRFVRKAMTSVLVR